MSRLRLSLRWYQAPNTPLSCEIEGSSGATLDTHTARYAFGSPRSVRKCCPNRYQNDILDGSSSPSADAI